jgi:hypothetical protein
MAAKHSGSLKQQIVDENTGDYEWVRRNFQLVHNTGVLHVKSLHAGDAPLPSINITDAAYAKEWSISSAAVGFGFDVVWDQSGSIVSFLSTDKESCDNWVTTINQSIQHVKTCGTAASEEEEDISDSDVSDVILNVDGPTNINRQTRPPLAPTSTSHGHGKQTKSKQRSNSGTGSVGEEETGNSLQESTRDISQWEDAGDISTTRAYLSPPRGNKVRAAAGGANSASSPLNKSTASEMSAIPRQQGNRKSTRSADVSTSGSFTFDSPQHFPNNLSNHNSHVVGTNNTGTEGMPMPAPMMTGSIASNMNSFEGGDESLIFQLQQKTLRLQAKAEREAIDAQVAREQLVKLQVELDQRSAQYSRDLDKALEREKLAVQAAKADIDMQILKATNENTAHNEAEMKAERLQSKRELSCIKEELAAERKRYSTLLHKETTARERAESNEVELKQEIASLREQSQRQQAEISRLHSVAKTDSEHWSRERELIKTDAETQRKKMDKEREDYSHKSQVTLRSKLSELNLKFDSRIKEMETNITETIRQQEESRRLQDIQVIIKQCEKDCEIIRTEERRNRTREVDNLRSSFKERERETAEDLVQLESLHSERLQRLENNNAILLKKIEKSDNDMKTAKDLAQRGSIEVRLQASQHMQQAEEATRKAESLLLQATTLRRELQESRVREGTYREQLNHSLEENRLQRAEMLEAQKQSQASASEATMWRKQAEEVDMTHSTSATTLQVARDEIRMLEHELARVKEDNYTLQQSLIRAEKIVYGQPRTTVESSRHSSNQLPLRRANSTTTNATPKVFRKKPLTPSPTFGSAPTGRI